MRFAAIDIGSNAVRLLFTNVFANKGKPIFKKESLIRVPLRLGEEAFTNGRLSESKADKLVKTMQSFKNLMEVVEVLDYKATATAAMREAANSAEIVSRVKQETGIEINVIDGEEEARVIYSNQIVSRLRPERTYLYVDVGGGSTEVSLFTKAHFVRSFSFPIGTLKIKDQQVTEMDWEPMKEVLQGYQSEYGTIFGIGSGGNINKLYKLYGNTEEGLITYDTIEKSYELLKSHTYIERIRSLGLKPDRADVIIPASEIFLNVMRWANIKTMFVPKVGLSDGLIHVLYDEHSDSIMEQEEL